MVTLAAHERARSTVDWSRRVRYRTVVPGRVGLGGDYGVVSGVLMRARGLVMLGVVVMVGAGACSGAAKQLARAPHTTSPTLPTTTLPPVAPLTGSLSNAAFALAHSALWVKIENTPDARPQSGLDIADVVYEEVVEAGITRFWAVFDSQAPDVVGPIRSVRMMDPDVVTPLRGVVAYSGGTEDNVALIRSAPVVWVDETNAGAAFFRDANRYAPHNLYGYTSQLWQLGGQPVPPPPLFSYVPNGEVCAGDPVQSMHLGFSNGYDPTFSFDAATDAWPRSYGTTPFLMTSGKQVAPTNVIVQFISYAGIGGDGELIGSGEAWLFCDGAVSRGSWSKTSAQSPTQFTDSAGNPMRLHPGQTYVELLPAGAGVDIFAGPPRPTSAPPPTPTTTRAASSTKKH
jgi:hypothetical protein